MLPFATFCRAVFGRLCDLQFLTSKRPGPVALMQAFLFAMVFGVRFAVSAIVLVHVALALLIAAGVASSLRSIERENDLRRQREAKAKRLVAQAADNLVVILRNCAVALAASLLMQSYNVVSDVVAMTSISTALSTEALLGWATTYLARWFGIESAADKAAAEMPSRGSGTAGGAESEAAAAAAARSGKASAGRPYVVTDPGKLHGVTRRGCLLATQ
jgi:hypothetical protein